MVVGGRAGGDSFVVVVVDRIHGENADSPSFQTAGSLSHRPFAWRLRLCVCVEVVVVHVTLAFTLAHALSRSRSLHHPTISFFAGRSLTRAYH